MLSVTNRSLTHSTGGSMDQNRFVGHQPSRFPQAVDDRGIDNRQTGHHFETESIGDFDDGRLIQTPVRVHAPDMVQAADVDNPIPRSEVDYLGAHARDNAGSFAAHRVRRVLAHGDHEIAEVKTDGADLDFDFCVREWLVVRLVGHPLELL
jgi:hypothetical protein